MYTKNRIVWGVTLILAILLSSCNFSPAAPTATRPDPNAVLTAAAQTAQARGTALALTTPSPPPATPTETATVAAPPTFPSITSTLPVSGTLAPVGGATPTLGAGATQGVPPAPASGDRAEFVADVTIPDGTAMDPGEDFTKTWRLQNVGTTTWSTAYSLVHASDDAIEGPASVSLPKNVAPGETVEVSVDLTAPEADGTHTSYWKLSNDRGQLFGIGPQANGAFYVQIKVGSGGEGGSSGTPAATSASGGSSDLLSGLSISIDTPEFSGACPHEYRVTAVFTLSEPATITYELEAGSDESGFAFDLPDAQTGAFATGTQTLAFTLNIDDSVDGWVRLLISDPEEVRSGQAEFSLSCD
jgi:hypothetical protein